MSFSLSSVPGDAGSFWPHMTHISYPIPIEGTSRTLFSFSLFVPQDTSVLNYRNIKGSINYLWRVAKTFFIAPDSNFPFCKPLDRREESKMFLLFVGCTTIPALNTRTWIMGNGFFPIRYFFPLTQFGAYLFGYSLTIFYPYSQSDLDRVVLGFGVPRDNIVALLDKYICSYPYFPL